jgi:hypothetical protein
VHAGGVLKHELMDFKVAVGVEVTLRRRLLTLQTTLLFHILALHSDGWQGCLPKHRLHEDFDTRILRLQILPGGTVCELSAFSLVEASPGSGTTSFLRWTCGGHLNGDGPTV